MRKAACLLLAVVLAVGMAPLPGYAPHAAAGEEQSAPAQFLNEPEDIPEAAVAPDEPAEDGAAAVSNAPAEDDLAADFGESADDFAETSSDSPAPETDADASIEETAAADVADDAGAPANEGEPAAMPAINTTMTAPNGVVVSVHAPEGAFPEGALLVVRPATAAQTESLKAAAGTFVDGPVADVRAVDISFVKEGRELEPTAGNPVSVSLSTALAVAGEQHVAVHLRDDATAELVAGATSTQASFVATDFSVYGIVGEGAATRVRVTFKDASGNSLGYQIVRAGDTLHAPDAPPAPESSKAFDCWKVGGSDASSYLGSALTDAQVSALAGNGTASSEDAGLYDVAAIASYRNAYSAVLHQNAKGSDAEGLVANTLVADASGKVNLADANYEPAEGTRLSKWADGSGVEHATDATMTLTADVELWPVLESGHWIRYSLGEGLGALEAQWVPAGSGDVAKSSLKTPADNANPGYAFDGWYLDSELTNAVGETLSVNADVRLHAKWNAGTTSYTIVCWIENHEGGPGEGAYTPMEPITVSGVTSGSTLSISYASNGINSQTVSNYYPNQEKTNAACKDLTIKGDGSTVANFYYNRNYWDIAFQKDNSLIKVGEYKWGQSVDSWYENSTLKTWLLDYTMKIPTFSENAFMPKNPVMPTLTEATGKFVTCTIGNTREKTTEFELYRECLYGEAGAKTLETEGVSRSYVCLTVAQRGGNAMSNIRVDALPGYKLVHVIGSPGAVNPTGSIGGISPTSITTSTGESKSGIQLFYALNTYNIMFRNVGDVAVGGNAADGTISGIRYTYPLQDYDPNYSSSKSDSVLNRKLKFVGWYTSESAANDPQAAESEQYKFDFSTATMPANDILLYAGWVPNYFDVAFNSNGGTSVDAQTHIEEGMLADEPAAPTRDGYTFAGWYSDADLTKRWDFESSAVHENTTLYARWTSSQSLLSVTYHGADGTAITPSPDSRTYTSGAHVRVAPAPASTTQEGATFSGWSTEQGNADKIVESGFTITQDADLYAIYEVPGDLAGNAPTVTLVSNYPSPYAEQAAVTAALQADSVNGSVTLPSSLSGASARGYRMTGWNTQADGNGDAYGLGTQIGVASDTTLYATWAKNEFSASLATSSFEYTGSAIKPAVTVADSATNEALTQDTDYELEYSDNVNVGTAKVKVKPKTDGNYAYADAVELTFSIGKKTLTVTADDKHSKKDADLEDFTWSVSPAPDAGDPIDEYVRVMGSVDKNKAGRYTLTPGYAEGKGEHPNYAITFVSGTYTVTRGDAKVTATGWEGAYDGAEHAVDVTVTATSASGTTGSGATAITHSGEVSIYYSETDFATLLSGVSLSDLAGADTGTTEFATAWNGMKSAVDSGISAGTVKKGQSPEYSQASDTPRKVYYLVVSDQVAPDVILGSKDVVINKAPLTVTAGSKQVTYGDAVPEYGVSYSGLVDADKDGDGAKAGVLTGALSLACSYAQGSDAGEYPIVASGLSAANYDITYAGGTLTVSPLALGVEWSGGPFTYDGAEHAVTANLTGRYDPDDEDAVSIGAVTNGAATAAGDYTARISSLAGAKADNYVLPDESFAWSIGARPATVKAAGQAVKVGAAAVSQDVSNAKLSGAVAGHVLSGVTLASTSTAAATTDGTITPSAARIVDASGTDVTLNYSIAYETGPLAVAADYTAENGKVIYALKDEVRMPVADAAKLIAASDTDAQLAELAGVHAFEASTGAALSVDLVADGGFAATPGTYLLTFQVNPTVQVKAVVYGDEDGGGVDDSGGDGSGDGPGGNGSGNGSDSVTNGAESTNASESTDDSGKSASAEKSPTSRVAKTGDALGVVSTALAGAGALALLLLLAGRRRKAE